MNKSKIEMDKNIVYGFIGGLFVGRYTGIVSNLVITGMALYFYNPEIYSYTTIETAKLYVKTLV